MQDVTPEDFRGLIDLWPSMGQFGREVAGDKERGRIFWRRNRVPKDLWPALIRAAASRGMVHVTEEFLASLYDAGRKQGR
jgi:hypothetical protein